MGVKRATPEHMFATLTCCVIYYSYNNLGENLTWVQIPIFGTGFKTQENRYLWLKLKIETIRYYVNLGEISLSNYENKI